MPGISLVLGVLTKKEKKKKERRASYGKLLEY
jgi:hypothetical protein